MKKVFEVIEMLEADGWNYQRTRGDHHIFTKAGSKRPITVAGSRNDVVPAGTLGRILRDAGLKKSE
ncbi:MAG: type II toxin-antitoxin system HicA family toxin [Bacteroidales bacterium]|nr:type II toxin-antitoxin system HicA family toxin [Bacteroidales bacterium]MBR6933158.1 type II toxin-antitoxin system HicA family toxin [Bacteroidales bacterium]